MIFQLNDNAIQLIQAGNRESDRGSIQPYMNLINPELFYCELKYKGGYIIPLIFIVFKAKFNNWKEKLQFCIMPRRERERPGKWLK